jgi:molybdopterin synthase sulfur carrier subunit
MPIRIEIPPPMRELTDGKVEVTATGSTVKEAIADLVQNYPALKSKLFDEKGSIRQHINLFVNDEDIRYLDEMDTKLTDGVLLALIPAVAGG